MPQINTDSVKKLWRSLSFSQKISLFTIILLLALSPLLIFAVYQQIELRSRAIYPVTPITPVTPSSPSTPTPSPTPTPYLTNGSFEIDNNPTDKLPDGWKFRKLVSSDRLVGKPVLDGQKSFRFTKLNSSQIGPKQLFQTINISGGADEAITVEAFGRSSGQIINGRVGIKLTVIYSEIQGDVDKKAIKFPTNQRYL